MTALLLALGVVLLVAVAGAVVFELTVQRRRNNQEPAHVEASEPREAIQRSIERRR